MNLIDMRNTPEVSEEERDLVEVIGSASEGKFALAIKGTIQDNDDVRDAWVTIKVDICKRAAKRNAKKLMDLGAAEVLIVQVISVIGMNISGKGLIMRREQL